MHLHEYQAKTLLRHYGIASPPYVVIEEAEALPAALTQLGVTAAVVKIQVHAGGRGKGGGVVVAADAEETERAVQALLGMRFTNKQTGPEGVVVRQLLVTPRVSYQKEGYLAITVDRKRGRALLIASRRGGVDIEEVAATHPDEVLLLPLPFNGKLRGYHKLQLAKCMGWEGATAIEGGTLADNLVSAFFENDAILLEINPLVQLEDGHFAALDAKATVDEDAAFRHPEQEGLFDPYQLSETERAARLYGLSYVSLDGNIGCMVNGAGLAMATMDIIEHYGGRPANFLDVGGGASTDKIAAGFTLLLDDPDVKVILVNIFGGIMNCAILARGIVAATAGRNLSQPIVIRMEGTNVMEGRIILTDARIGILADSLADAAAKAVYAV